MRFKKIISRIIFDFFLVIIGVFIVTVLSALFPMHMPNKYTPQDMGFGYEEVIFSSTDNKELSGWLIYSPNAEGTIICCHGYPANKSDILPTVSFLYPHFNLFLFDFRGHGDSQGRLVSFGLREDKDLLGAINYIKKNPKTNKLPIGIWGYSFGGAVAIKTCAQSKEIKALVTDSAYADFPEMIIQHYGNLGPLKYIFGAGGKFIGNILFRGKLSELSPETFMDSLNTPILIIHASGDSLVPVEHAERLYDKAKQPKELLILQDITHGAIETGLYRYKIKMFFEKYLRDEKTSPSPIFSI
jgi:pimeloyl-ACP methyl ester carboxylesterase